jgi:uncharacterized protein YkwD
VFSLRQLAAGLAAALLVALLAAAPRAGAATCARADAAPRTVTASAVERATVCTINAERRTRGLGALSVNPRLVLAARRHSRDMVRHRYFAHLAPSGSDPAYRIGQTGYLSDAVPWLVGETLAWGTGDGASARSIVLAWMHSPDHRRILLRGSYRELGVGVVWGAPLRRSGPQATVTAEFGVIG